MGRPPALPVDQKVRLVLAVLSARTTVAQAARDYRVSETSVCNWRRQFLEGGRLGLAEGAAIHGGLEAEARLRAENERLKSALRDMTVLVRVWKMSAESRLGPSRTSR
jgi:transposase